MMPPNPLLDTRKIPLKPLVKAKAATIAAAMRCSEGIILCADSLLSGMDVNLSQSKILPFSVPYYV